MDRDEYEEEDRNNHTNSHDRRKDDRQEDKFQELNLGKKPCGKTRQGGNPKENQERKC
jgi:hypothetical protein